MVMGSLQLCHSGDGESAHCAIVVIGESAHCAIVVMGESAHCAIVVMGSPHIVP